MLTVTFLLSRSRSSMAVLVCASQHDLSVAFVLLTLERNEVLHSISPASSHCATLACSHCMRSWPKSGALRQALAHCKFFQHSTIRGHGQPRFTAYCAAPPGAMVSDAQHSIRVDSCHSPFNLGQCARGSPSPHVSKASYAEAVHEPHQHLGSLARQVLCSQVRRVRLGGDFLHCELPAAHRLLEPQVLNLDVLRFAQPCSAY